MSEHGKTAGEQLRITKEALLDMASPGKMSVTLASSLS